MSKMAIVLSKTAKVINIYIIQLKVKYLENIKDENS